MMETFVCATCEAPHPCDDHPDAPAEPSTPSTNGQPPAPPHIAEAQDPGGPPMASTWAPVEPGPFLDGTYEPPSPTHLRRSDGLHLFYPGRVNLLFGESEVGKGWVALLAVAQAIERGETVLYIDLEDYPDTIYARLLALGCGTEHLAERLAYVRPESALDDQAREDLNGVVRDLRPSLVIVDGMTGAMRILGLDDNRGTEVDAFYAALPEPLAATGAAVVLIDHVPKSSDNRGKGPIGSQHKRARVSGAGYRVEVIKHLAPGRAGQLKVTIDKDRLGAIRREHPTRAGDFHLDASGDTLRAELRSHQARGDQGTWRPTVLMQRVSMVLEGVASGLSQNAITKAVEGNYTYLVQAVDQLVEEGYVVREDGPRKSKIHRSVRPFREDDPTASGPATASATASTASDCLQGPGGSQGGSPSRLPPTASGTPLQGGPAEAVSGPGPESRSTGWSKCSECGRQTFGPGPCRDCEGAP